MNREIDELIGRGCKDEANLETLSTQEKNTCSQKQERRCNQMESGHRAESRGTMDENGRN